MKALLSILIVSILGCEQKPQSADTAGAVSALNHTKSGYPLVSDRSLVQRKRAAVIRNTLSKALTLNSNGMCLELGVIPCADVVHRVALGGMDAYGNSQYDRPATISLTSPIALERLVLSACTQRAGIDISNPENAVIFKDVELSIDGRLVLNEKITNSIQRLYQRSHMRNPTPDELSGILELYEKIFESEPIGAARNWMVLSCFSVLTTVESVFL